ncbi:MAG: DciA family protein [Acidimicrobiales bacterium]
MPTQPDGEEPAGLGASLDRLSRSLGAPSARVIQTVFSRWDEVVGEALAANAKPCALRNGVLTVEVSDPVWASEVRWMATELLDRLAAVAGEAVAGELQVRVAGVKRG